MPTELYSRLRRTVARPLPLAAALLASTLALTPGHGGLGEGRTVASGTEHDRHRTEGVAKFAGAALAADPTDSLIVYDRDFVSGDFGVRSYVEKFGAVPGSEFTLKVANLSWPPTDMTQGMAADSVVVKLNGVVMYGPTQFGPKEVRSSPVSLLSANTLEVSYKSRLFTNIKVTVLGAPDPTFALYSTGTNNSNGTGASDLSFSFDCSPVDASIPSACRDGGPPFYLIVQQRGLQNADGTWRNRIDSGSVTLNGTTVLTSSDLGRQVSTVVRQVQLRSDAPNTVSVSVTTPTEGADYRVYLTATDKKPPSVTSISPAPETIIGTDALDVTVRVSNDQTMPNVRVNGVLAVRNWSAGTWTAHVALATEGSNALLVRATDAAGNFGDSTIAVTRDTQAPVLTVSAPAEGSSVTANTIAVSGTVTDVTPVTVSANGTSLPVGANGSLSGDVPIIDAQSSVTVIATDAAGHQTTISRTLSRGGTLPPDPSTVAPLLDLTVATNLASAASFLYSASDPIQTGVDSGVIVPARIAVLRGRVTSRDGQPLTGVTVSVLDHSELGQTRTRADGRFDLAVNGGGSVVVQFTKAGLLPAQRQVEVPWQDYVALPDVTLVPLDTAATTIDFSAPIQVARGSVVSDADGSRRTTLFFQQGTTATMDLPDGSSQPLPTLSVRATEYTVGDNGPAAMPAQLPPTSGYTYAVELSADEAIAAGATGVRFSKPVSVYVENFLGFPIGLHVPVAFYDRRQARWVPIDDGRIIKIVSVTNGLADVSLDAGGAPADSATLAALGITSAERERLAQLYVVGQSLWRMPVTHFSPLDGNYPFGPPRDALRPALQQPSPDRDNAPPKECGSIIECTTQVLGDVLGISGTPFDLVYRSDRSRGHDASRTREIVLTGSSIPASLIRVELIVDVAGQRFQRSFPASPNQRYTFQWDGRDAYGRIVQGEQPMTIQLGYVYPMLYSVPADAARSFGLTCYGTVAQPGWEVCAIGSTLSGRPRQETTLWEETRLTVGNFDAAALDLGGWTLSAHHVYDPIGRVLHLGNGDRRWAEPVVERVAGTTLGYSGDGGPAIDAQFSSAGVIAAHADGSVYVADNNNHRIRRIDADGIVTTVAGTGATGFEGDGGPALQAQIDWVSGMAFGPDGSLYFADVGAIRRISPNGVISRVAGRYGYYCAYYEGPSSEFARQCGDGRLASDDSVAFWGPNGIDVGRDGSIYIADGNATIRRIGPDGVIRRLAGDTLANGCIYGQGSSDPSYYDQRTCGDGNLAWRAQLYHPADVKVAPDGSVYVADGNAVVRRIMPDGTIRRAAGRADGSSGVGGDGGPATEAELTYPRGLAIGRDGSVYIADPGYVPRTFDTMGRIRRIGPDGVITTVAGVSGLACATVDAPDCADAGPPTSSKVFTERLAVGPDGYLYFAHSQAPNYAVARIRRLSLHTAGYSGRGEISIASEDGSAIYHFDANGRHLRTTDAVAGAPLLSFDYDAVGRLISITDVDSLVTRIERTGAGAPTAIVAPFGQRTTLATNARRQLTGVTNPAGEQVVLAPDSVGLLRSLTDAREHASQYTYDTLGRLTLDENAAGGYKRLVRTGTDSSYSVAVSTPLGRTRTYGMTSLRNGDERRTMTEPSGLTTVSVEKPDRSVTVTSPDGVVATAAPGPDPRFGMQAPLLKSATVTTAGGLRMSVSAGTQVVSAADAPIRVASETDSVIVNGRVFRTTYDAATHRVTSVSAEGRQSVDSLDALGRVVLSRVPGLEPVRFRYDAQGRLSETRLGGRVWSYAYGTDGLLARAAGPLADTVQFARDSAGRVVRQRFGDGRKIAFTYDRNGNVTSITPPSRPAHLFAVDAVDWDSSYVAPDAGSGAAETRLEYDADHDLKRITRPDGQLVEFGYDSVGRASAVTHQGGTLTFGYSPTTGQPATASAPGGVGLAFSYDGSLPTGTTWSGPVSGSVSFRFDNDFRVASEQVNGADSVAFGYDHDGLLTRAGAMTLSNDPTTGLLSGTTLSGVTRGWSYDSLAQVTGHVVRFNGTPIFETNYAYDSVGRITTLTETRQGTTVTLGYRYDRDGRLHKVTRDGSVVATYDYDANGNRLQLTGTGGVVSGTYDAQDRMTSYGGATYGYSANGELERKVVGTDTTRYRYDALGNLLGVTLPGGQSVDYVVDAAGRRIGRKVGGTLVQGFLYSGQLAPAVELNGQGQVVSRFVYGLRPNVPDYMVRGGVTYQLVTDHLGSVRLVVDVASGSVAQEVDYDEFGRVTRNSSPGFQPFGFAGGLYDEDTKLVRFGARDYDAETGRWTAKDPLGFGAGSNFYVYVDEDPTNLVDSYGLGPCSPGHFGSASASAAVFADLAHKAPLIRHDVAWFLPKTAAMAATGLVQEVIASRLLGWIAGRLAGRGATVVAEAAAESEDAVTLYHQGSLRAGSVSPARTLHVSPSSELTHYHPDGQLFEFRVPKSTLYQWRAQGLAQPGMDLHQPTGIITPEWKIFPPASGQMNNFLVPR